MTVKDRIAGEALALPPQDRAELAELLEQSLGSEDDLVDEEVMQEWIRRSEEIKTGAVVPRDACEVLAELWTRQRDQTVS